MYGFITDTWNPLIGKCPHNCPYCSTNKFYYPELVKRYSGKPRLDEKALKDNLGKGNFIFVCAQNDLLAEEIPKEFIEKVLSHVNKFENNYFFQTKNPRRFHEFDFPYNSIFCTTIETNRLYKCMVNAPRPQERAYYMPIGGHITIEPIIDFDIQGLARLIKLSSPSQVNIGANSYAKIKLPEPPKEKITELIFELSQFTKVHIKDNLKRLLK